MTLKAEGRETPLGFIILFFPKFAVDLYPMWVPYELMTLGTALAKSGYEVQLLDERIIEDAHKIAALRMSEALFLGICSRPGDQVARAIELFTLAKDIFPLTATVWGGWFPSSFPEECLALPQVDYVVRGAADESIIELAHCLRTKYGDITGVSGVSSARHGYPAIHNPKRPLADINKTPLINWKLFPMGNYVTPDGCMSHYTSRGCPGNCRFCGVPRLYPAIWSGYSAERVVDDVRYFVQELGVRILKFQDVDVFADTERILSVCRGFIRESLAIRWIADLRVANAIEFDDTTWRTIADSGCCELELGAESGSEEQLSAIFKECTVNDIFEVVEKITNHGIHARVNFVLGFPEEGYDDIHQTLDLVQRLEKLGDLVRFHFYRFAPSPTTRLGKRVWMTLGPRHDGKLPATVSEINAIAMSYDQPKSCLCTCVT